jgi:thiazole synthase
LGDAYGKVWLSYNRLEYLEQRHSIPNDLVKNVSGIRTIAEEAVRQGKSFTIDRSIYNKQMTDSFVIAGRQFRSRLIVGTGKYKSFQETTRALEASGADMVTVAVRRVNLDRSKESLLDYLDPKKYFLLPNTAGCYTADEAIRAARLGREVGLSDWVKLEVIGDQATLYPDVQATLEATRVLVKEGFTVLPYTSDDVVFAKRLFDAGASAVMPLGAPIGSGLGIQNAANIRILREVVTSVPLILDAGVGT